MEEKNNKELQESLKSEYESQMNFMKKEYEDQINILKNKNYELETDFIQMKAENELTECLNKILVFSNKKQMIWKLK
uniref:Uncharacterized protein n=1 Tax=Panagrolaimus davidi TaxID=227884 RepID=A0A914PS88_9BILA